MAMRTDTLHLRCCAPPALSRRDFLRCAAAGGLLLLPAVGATQGSRSFSGEVRVNGQRADARTVVRAGDTVVTGPGANAMFAVGADAFLLRENSSLTLERQAGEIVISGLRMLTGALLGVFGRSARARNVVTSTVTAGIRGTGVYVEADAAQTYFCTCYGEVELTDTATGTRHVVLSANHSPLLVYGRASGGRAMQEAGFRNHSNAELQMLEQSVGRTSPLKG